MFTYVLIFVFTVCASQIEANVTAVEVFFQPPNLEDHAVEETGLTCQSQKDCVDNSECHLSTKKCLCESNFTFNGDEDEPQCVPFVPKPKDPELENLDICDIIPDSYCVQIIPKSDSESGGNQSVGINKEATE